MISESPISDVTIGYLPVISGTPVWVMATSDALYVQAFQSTIYVQAGL
jgi:hypothetical protein